MSTDHQNKSTFMEIDLVKAKLEEDSVQSRVDIDQINSSLAKIIKKASMNHEFEND